MKKIAHLVYVPFTGLGLYGGHRGKRWLRNRIKIFCQFVIPSLRAQTNQDFIIWVSWRHEDRGTPEIAQLQDLLWSIFTEERVVFTYSGICFYDDKYPPEVAKLRLINAVHGAMGELFNFIGDADTVLMTIQPSDDCYEHRMVERARTVFAEDPSLQCYGYAMGYVMDYTTLKIAPWNPTTTPPFYTIKFPREIFTDPYKHVSYTGAYTSHEYVKDHLKSYYTNTVRGFIVGTHGENISTVFNHPFAGAEIDRAYFPRWGDFGLEDVKPIKLSISLRKMLMRKLPHGWQRKLRYWLGERGFARLYNWLRS